MTFRASWVYPAAVGTTLLAAAAALIDERLLATAQYGILVVGTVVIGIPHGATDDHIARRLGRGGRRTTFYATYLAAALLVAGVWVASPTAALIGFLLISMYHFGQSTLFYAALSEASPYKKALYMPLGAFYLVPPILFRYAEAAPIIRAILGYDPFAVSTVERCAPWVTGALLLVNVSTLLVLLRRRRIVRSDAVRELVTLGSLLSLYVVAPLFVSFAVYWVFWHSLNSVIEIARTFRGPSIGRRIARFYRAAGPLSIVTFVGIGLVVALTGSYGDRSAMIALFFCVIAALTVPHSAVMERLYRRAGRVRDVADRG